MHFSENITSARITPYTGVNYKKYIERSSMFKGAQIKLGGMKESKGLEHSTKITKMMMLTIK
jgi:hypothetical protein